MALTPVAVVLQVACGAFAKNWDSFKTSAMRKTDIEIRLSSNNSMSAQQ